MAMLFGNQIDNNDCSDGLRDEYSFGSEFIGSKFHRPGGVSNFDDRRGCLHRVACVDRFQEFDLFVGAQEAFTPTPRFPKTKFRRSVAEELKNPCPGHQATRIMIVLWA